MSLKTDIIDIGISIMITNGINDTPTSASSNFVEATFLLSSL